MQESSRIRKLVIEYNSTSKSRTEEFSYLVSSVISIVESYEFDIVQTNEDPKEFSYCIGFEPRPEEQVEFCTVLNPTDMSSNSTISRSFRVGSQQYAYEIDVIRAIKKICSQLKLGYYEVLDQY